jgi:transcriptional regulator with XRE-family HTH domain
MVTTAVIPSLRRRWRLKIAMEDARFTSSDMAAELGVSRATVSRWLASDSVPVRSAYLKQWAKACGVDETWLIYGPTCECCGSMPGPVSNPHPVDELLDAEGTPRYYWPVALPEALSAAA